MAGAPDDKAMELKARAEGHRIAPERREPILKGIAWLSDSVVALKDYLQTRGTK